MSGTLIGQVLLNQFRVDAFVASGGMGAVYRVWDLKRNVPLAMKTLHAELAEDPAIFKRFKREARALKKLAHPNIVPFYGLYETADFVFLLQAFIDGHSLRDILRSRNGQPLPLSEALIYIKALSAALGFAHAHDVVHCDVKPGNVMIDQGGNIYLTDFGIARHAESTTTSLATVGTAAYMAPEQIRGDTVTPATDVYALGVMLFEMLAGERPFKGSEKGTESGGQTVNERIRYAHLHLSPPDPSTISAQITPALAAVLLKSLEKDPANRYSDTLEMFSALCTASEFSQESVPNRLLPSGKEVAGQDTQSGQTPPFWPSGQTFTPQTGRHACPLWIDSDSVNYILHILQWQIRWGSSKNCRHRKSVDIHCIGIGDNCTFAHSSG
jgi:eukaryotic-like serine/threonine-protein kinase